MKYIDQLTAISNLKKIFLGIAMIIGSLFIMISCNGIKNNTSTDHIKRERIIGEWKLTKESIRKLKSQDSLSGNRLQRFQLNSDSSAVIFFTNSVNGKSTTWSWKTSFEIGNSTLGMGVESDISVVYQQSSNNIHFFGFQINENNGKITLITHDEMVYEKS